MFIAGELLYILLSCMQSENIQLFVYASISIANYERGCNRFGEIMSFCRGWEYSVCGKKNGEKDISI